MHFQFSILTSQLFRRRWKEGPHHSSFSKGIPVCAAIQAISAIPSGLPQSRTTVCNGSIRFWLHVCHFLDSIVLLVWRPHRCILTRFVDVGNCDASQQPPGPWPIGH